MKIIAACCLFLLLAGCAPKCKKASFWEGGYQEFQVNDREYILTYQEGVVSGLITSHTPSDIDRILALRAAELTLQNGFTYFDIKRDRSPKILHIYCYAEEDTSTAIDALAFAEKYSNFYTGKEETAVIAMKGDI